MNANLVDQVTGSGGLSGVDVSDDNDVNVKLFLSMSRIDVSIFFLENFQSHEKAANFHSHSKKTKHLQ